MSLYKFFRNLVFLLGPEVAHKLAIFGLKSGIFQNYSYIKEYDNLKTSVGGIEINNPIGLAAGFDKNADCLNSLSTFGFGFIEAGTVTMLMQSGNPKPRIFRLTEDRAIINSLGFNNRGHDHFKKNLNNFNKNKQYGEVIGSNIGKNKSQINYLSDYDYMLKALYNCSDYITINISSPNTSGLRDLQQKESFSYLIENLSMTKRQLALQYQKKIPLFVKISPDLSVEALEDIAEVVIKYHVDAVIISNTTTQRPLSLQSKYKNRNGGLSGLPLCDIATTKLREFYEISNKRIPIISAGGIFTAKDVMERIKNGASAVQIYTAFIYEGFSLIEKIKQELSILVKEEGFRNIKEAVGTAVA